MTPLPRPHHPRRKKFLLAAAITLALLLTAYTLFALLVQPSNARAWAPDQARIPTASFTADTVRIDNLRNNLYRSTTDYDVRWETRSYDLRTIDSVWFVVEPFSGWRGPAHTLLSFGFGNGEYVAISVEIRKEAGEEFSPLGGLLRQYELAYVIGDERDLIGLRANHRHDDVYLYPVHATPAQIRTLFTDMLARANAVAAEPEFYNTLTNTCTSNIVDHVNLVAPNSIGWSYKTVLPGFADDLAYDLGLIDTPMARDTFRAAHRINALAAEAADSEAFSATIRRDIVRGER